MDEPAAFRRRNGCPRTHDRGIAYFTGMEGDLYAGKNPLPVTPELLKRTGEVQHILFSLP